MLTGRRGRIRGIASSRPQGKASWVATMHPATIGPLALVAGLKYFVVRHAVAGSKSNMLLGLAHIIERHQRSGQGFVRRGRPAQQVVSVRHIQFEFQVSVAHLGSHLTTWPSALSESPVEMYHRIGVAVYLQLSREGTQILAIKWRTDVR